MSVIEKIRNLNEEMGIPLSMIATYASCHPCSLANYLKGKTYPTPRIENQLHGAVQAIVYDILKLLNDDENTEN